MRNSSIKTTLSLILIGALFSTEFVLPTQVFADDQNNGFTTVNGNQFLNYDNPNTGNNPYKLSFSTITPQLLTSVVSCTGIQNKVAAKLLAVNDAIQKEVDKLVKKATDAISKALMSKAERVAKEQGLELARKGALIGAGIGAAGASATVAGTGSPGAGQVILDLVTDVPHPTTTRATDTDTQKKLDQAAQDKIKADAEIARKAQAERCLNGIAVALAKNQLTSMTKYTMNWINHGFNGNSMFVQNVDSFMSSITSEIVQKEVNLFKDPNTISDYPYGRDIARGIVNTYQAENNFSDSMRSTMDQYVPGATSPADATEKFSNEFTWTGWTGLTLYDTNNPFGSRIKIAQNLSDNVSQQRDNAQNDLNQGGGFISQKKCVQYARPNPVEDESTYLDDNGNLKCLSYATVTPSSTIKAKIDTYVNTPERQLELVKTMDDALNSLFAALLSKFENQGLASLSSSVNNYTSSTSGGFGINQVFDSNGNSISSSLTTTGGNSSGGDGFFDLTKDLGNKYTVDAAGKLTIQNKGVLQLQHDYVDGVTKSKAIIANVVPSLGKLDYCIPGPNPKWNTNASQAISDYLDSVSSDPGTAPLDPATLDDTLTSYENSVNTIYGAGSPMQDPTLGNKSYLKMSQAGLALTKDITNYADTVSGAQEEYGDALLDSSTNITQLNAIKDKVNKIIVQAQARRTTKRTQAGLPAIKSICLSTEKVTYLDNGVLK